MNPRKRVYCVLGTLHILTKLPGIWTSLRAQSVKNLPAMQETWVPFLSWKDPLEQEMAPLQYSCLENPMDRGAWQTIVHGSWGRARLGD